MYINKIKRMIGTYVHEHPSLKVKKRFTTGKKTAPAPSQPNPSWCVNPICTGVKFRSHTRGGPIRPPLLEIAPGGPFRPKLVTITKFSLNFQKNHIWPHLGHLWRHKSMTSLLMTSSVAPTVKMTSCDVIEWRHDIGLTCNSPKMFVSLISYLCPKY